MRFISLFAGIGGFDLGLERAGMMIQCKEPSGGQSVAKNPNEYLVVKCLAVPCDAGR